MNDVARSAELLSINEARRALAKLKKEIEAAPSLSALDAIARKAAAIQRFHPVKDVSDEAGETWVAADIKLGRELEAIGKAQGTRGQLVSRGVIGRAASAPPIPSRADLGLPGDAGKKRAARAVRLAGIAASKLKAVFETLKGAGKGVTPNAVAAVLRQEAKRDKIYAVANAAFSADGPFGTAIIDPPWQVEKIDRDERPNQDAFDYPRMSLEELRAFLERELIPRLADDAHVFMWTTQKYLPATILLLEQVGFRYVLNMVWRKPGGFQPVGLPQYNCEFAVYARHGSPVFIDTKDFFCCFEAARREHSRKPDLFYDTVRRVTGGSRIDVFSREAREGFAQYGNETAKFDEAAE